MRTHARDLELAGRNFGTTLAHILIGMVIGAIVCVREARGEAQRSVLLQEAAQRVRTLARAFRGVVFAQVKISAINTALTAIYLVGVLPMVGVHLPFAKTMIAATFVAGLLPVVGNLISNTIIVIVSLSNSLTTAIASLIFLIAIHKLEYFLNARIVGAQINASAWELLCAMLVFESAYGLPGLVAAPIFYAYVKAEMRDLGLI
jgi:predicted PurR-regulated permease PerM